MYFGNATYIMLFFLKLYFDVFYNHLLIVITETSRIVYIPCRNKDFLDILPGLMTIWHDLESLAEYLKMPRSTIYRLAQRGVIPGHKIGRSWRFDQDEVDAWIKKGAKRAVSATRDGGENDRTRTIEQAS